MNYVDDADLDRLAGSRCSVVYCPRSHHFFGHEPHRFADMRKRGINVCLGTDSLASNSSLSILDELRFLCREHPGLDPHTLLAMATIAGARALGLSDQVGSLERGKRADLTVVLLQNPRTADPLEDLLHGHNQPS